jgi:hypothetical protein
MTRRNAIALLLVAVLEMQPHRIEDEHESQTPLLM